MLLLLLLLSRFSRVQLCVTPQTAAHQAPHPWESPGKNTGVGCHFLLQCMKVKSESEVAQSCLTLHDPMDCSPPGSSVRGIFQAIVLEWGAIAFSECDSTLAQIPFCDVQSELMFGSLFIFHAFHFLVSFISYISFIFSLISTLCCLFLCCLFSVY